MSAIPPSNIASVLQAGVTQRQQSRIDDAEHNERVRTSRELSGREDAILEVEATDDDTQVHADAEGSGGSGRETREFPMEEGESSAARAADEITVGEDGMPHLDLTV
ncbi:MAG: hypothetical protein ACE5F9_00305 [Phycisphaerae bacterium]